MAQVQSGRRALLQEVTQRQASFTCDTAIFPQDLYMEGVRESRTILRARPGRGTCRVHLMLAIHVTSAASGVKQGLEACTLFSAMNIIYTRKNICPVFRKCSHGTFHLHLIYSSLEKLGKLLSLYHFTDEETEAWKKSGT